MLIAMVITTLLLTALAGAINAAAVNMNVNEDSFKAVNSARQCLSRITTELRSSSSVAVGEDLCWCSFQNAAGEFVAYYHSDSSDKLLYRKDGHWYTICENVTDMKFTKGLDPEDSGVVRNVRIKMTVQSGDIVKNFAAAAVVRRNMD